MAGTGSISTNFYLILSQTASAQETLTSVALPTGQFEIENMIVAGGAAVGGGATINVSKISGGVTTRISPGGGPLNVQGGPYNLGAGGAIQIPLNNNEVNATFNTGDQIEVIIGGGNPSQLIFFFDCSAGANNGTAITVT